MNANTAIAIINTGLILLTGFAIWHTNSLWSLIILLFFATVKVVKKEKTNCTKKRGPH